MILQTDDYLPQLRRAIRRTLAYADVFAYPLTAREIHRYLIELLAPFEAVAQALADQPDWCNQADGFYSLPGRMEIVHTRQQRAQNAARLWPYALRYGWLLARLPFVRMVAVTGALAMNNVESGADIDYLIVTEPGHLWLTRAMVLLYGRFSRLHGVMLCPNYLVTLRALAFSDQTLYTAHELAQMIPLAGLDVYEEIRRQNPWVLRFLPNAGAPPNMEGMPPKAIPRSLAHPVLEAAMQIPPVAWIEHWEMNRKIGRLRREQNASAESFFSTDVCKGHDQRHQDRTRQALEERLNLLENL